MAMRSAEVTRPVGMVGAIAQPFDIDKRKIVLPEPLKALGETSVPVKVHRDVTAQVRVKVVAEGAK